MKCQMEKDKNNVISLICKYKAKSNKLTNKNNLTDTHNRMVVTRGERGGVRAEGAPNRCSIIIFYT